MRKRLPWIVAYSALALAILAFAGSVVQVSLIVSEAQAQSSVRPPDDAVNVDTATSTAGGSVRPPAGAETNAPMQPGVPRVPDFDADAAPAMPQGVEGGNSVSSVWAKIRQGNPGGASIPDPQAAVLVQDAGMNWLDWRAKGGPLQKYGGWALAGIAIALLLFYLLRGRVRIGHGRSDQTIERFKAIERFSHWVLAVSFIILSFSGLNLLYGKDYLLPLVGKDLFATVTMAGKWAHNNIAWAFMVSLVMIFVLWVRHNLPSLLDLKWFAMGGGLFGGKHPPARKFNAGQKIVFWSVIILGASISASGISLLFPYEAPMFGKTFALLNDIGISELAMGAPLATELTPIQEMQYAQIWHSIVAFAMIFIILAHIYIGSLGMEGAFAAMGSGQVDRNWAKEHHGLWVDEVDAKTGRRDPAATPAE